MPTVTAEGSSLARLIAGVVVREATTQIDERGELCEINMPTTPYNHADPDKYRLPLESPEIPYSFAPKFGW